MNFELIIIENHGRASMSEPGWCVWTDRGEFAQEVAYTSDYATHVHTKVMSWARHVDACMAKLSHYYLAESVSVITPYLQRAALTLHSISTSRESTQLTITRASFTTLSTLGGWHRESDPLICSPSPQKSEMYIHIHVHVLHIIHVHVCMYIMHVPYVRVCTMPVQDTQCT